MTKHRLLLLAGLALLLIRVDHVVGQRSAGTPNIVVILADDLGYGDLSSYGATRVRTPNIDRLARDGVRFTDAHSPHSVCTPTRYGLLTGRYAWRTWNGSATLWSDDPLLIDTARLTLPKLLRAGGYESAVIGKWHLGFGAPGAPGWDDVKGPDYNRALVPGPLEVGFDYFFGIPHVGQYPHVLIENHHVLGLDPKDPLEIVLDERWKGRASYLERLGTPAHRFLGGEAARYEHEELAIALTEKAVEWIEKRDREPFFLYFAARNPHGPLRPNARFKGTSEIGVYGDFLNELDWSVGQVLDALDRRGFTENTLVMFSSDNGGLRPRDRRDYNGHDPNGGLAGHKSEAYEGGTRVPLLVRWPGRVRPGSESGALVALTDVLATTAEMLGVTLPYAAGEDSFSFLHALLGTRPAEPVRESLVQDGNRGLFAVREGPWKLIVGRGGGGNPPGAAEVRMDTLPMQLYHLTEDPGETKNRYGTERPVEVRLRALLREILYSGRSRPAEGGLER